MNTPFKLFILTGLILWGGCKSPVGNQKRLVSHREPTVERVCEVRTGGELNDPKIFTIDPSRPLTLRQAILQSGSIRRPNEPTERISIVQIQSSEPPVARADVTDSVILETIKPFLSNEEAVHQLLGVNRDGRASGFNGSRAYSAPTETSLDAYMKSAVASMVVTATNAPASTLDFAGIDPSSTNRIEQLQILRAIFEGSKANAPEFASAAVLVFDRLMQALDSNATALPKPDAAASFTTVPTLQGIVQNNAKPILPTLIGLENNSDSTLSRSTTYFHPDLIFKTAIGDIPLRDGDFVFAIRAEDTSLPLHQPIQHEWSVPVLGIDDEFTAIDPNSFPQIQQVFQLKRDAIQRMGGMATIEDIGVLTRHNSGPLGIQSYYLPVSNEAEGTIEVPTGFVAPGDHFQFTYASRSPLVLARFVEAMRDRFHERQSGGTNEADCKTKLPADARVLSKWNAAR